MMYKRLFAIMMPALMCGMSQPLSAQNLFLRLDSMLTRNYHKANYDTAYIERPRSKWAIVARVNMSGAEIETEGMDNGAHFKSLMEAKRKTTVSLGFSYSGILLSASLNPAQMMGKYHDYEFNMNCYRRNFGFDIIYQDAKNFTGWYDQDGLERMELRDGTLKVKTLNLNAYYAFNNRRFSYPAAFSQSYIQRRPAGSFLLAASCMAQQAALDVEQEQELKLKMLNVGIGAGYGYNFVPGKGWLLHISALPTLVAYSKATMTYGDDRVSLRYKFPEFIITTRGAVVRQWNSSYAGLSMVYNYTNTGDRDDFSVYNSKWRIRTFFGLRL